MKLLDSNLLVKTGDVDHADWNYKLMLGNIQRLRFKLVIKLLEGSDHNRMLEVGYGSGIFMPELSQHCYELYGIDVHNKSLDVFNNLAKGGIKANLCCGNIETTTYTDNFFDCVVAISSLEFVEDIDKACYEIHRILKPDGCLIVVTPGYSKVLDIALKILTGELAEKDYGNRRERLLPTLEKYFSTARVIVRPILIGQILPVYTGLKLHPKNERHIV
jgi:ubiquinone/menaquinone biosynthesis C-methylase UbiE